MWYATCSYNPIERSREWGGLLNTCVKKTLLKVEYSLQSSTVVFWISVVMEEATKLGRDGHGGEDKCIMYNCYCLNHIFLFQTQFFSSNQTPFFLSRCCLILVLGFIHTWMILNEPTFHVSSFSLLSLLKSFMTLLNILFAKAII